MRKGQGLKSVFAICQDHLARERTGYFGLAALSSVAADLLLPEPYGLQCAALIYTIVSTWLCFMEGQQSKLALSPIVCSQACNTLFLGVGSLYSALVYGSPGYAYGGDGYFLLVFWQVPASHVAYGHAIMVAGSWAYYVGMRHLQPVVRSGDRRNLLTSSPATLVMAFLTGAIFLAGREYFGSLLGSISALFSLLPCAVLCLVALNPPGVVTKSAFSQVSILLAGALCLLAISSTRDSKTELMFSFFPLICWLVERRKFRLLLGGGLAMALVYVAVIAPLVTSMRDSGIRAENGSISTYAPEVTNRVLEQVTEQATTEPLDYLGKWVGATMSRLFVPIEAGMVVWLTEKEGFLYANDLGYIPGALIPRFLWPDKPNLDRGPYFSAKLGLADDASSATSSTGQTAAGELYWHFGWPGVFIGMYLLGIAVAGLVWRCAGDDPRSGIIEMTAYVVSIAGFMQLGEAAAGPALVGAITIGIFFQAWLRLRQLFFPKVPVRTRERHDGHHHSASIRYRSARFPQTRATSLTTQVAAKPLRGATLLP